MKYSIVLSFLFVSKLSVSQNVFPTPSGNVGIGTTSPTSLLHLSSASSLLQVQSTGSANYAAISLINDSGIPGVAISSFGSAYPTGSAYARPNGVGIYTTSNYNAAAGIAIAARNPSGYITFHSGGDTERMRIDASGNVGIGTTTPAYSLDVNGTVRSNRYVRITQVGTGGYGFIADDGAGSTTFSITRQLNNETRFQSYGFHTFYSGGNTGVERMRIDASGNVGIGTGTAALDAMLAVSGQVHAQEVKVSIAVPGPDYVFEKDYKLISLEEVKNYIDQNKHLPEVPSAKEMEKNGVQLGEMNMLLLKKIEELTLHLIELKRENEDQRLAIEKLNDLILKK